MKKGILALIAVILILALILGIKIITNMEKTSYTTAQIKNKILSAYNYKNYTYKCIKDGVITTKKVMGNVIVTEDADSYLWIDGASMYIFSIDKKNNTYKVKDLNSTTKDLLYKKDFLDMKSLVNSYKDDLVYLRNENYNGRNCLRIRAGENDQYLIDEETGFVLKYEPEKGSIEEFSIEIDNVTEDDVKLPDLSQYNKAS